MVFFGPMFWRYSLPYYRSFIEIHPAWPNDLQPSSGYHLSLTTPLKLKAGFQVHKHLDNFHGPRLRSSSLAFPSPSHVASLIVWRLLLTRHENEVLAAIQLRGTWS